MQHHRKKKKGMWIEFISLCTLAMVGCSNADIVSSMSSNPLTTSQTASSSQSYSSVSSFSSLSSTGTSGSSNSSDNSSLTSSSSLSSSSSGSSTSSSVSSTLSSSTSSSSSSSFSSSSSSSSEVKKEIFAYEVKDTEGNPFLSVRAGKDFDLLKNNKNSYEIVLPESIDHLPVKEIAENAFSSYGNVSKIVVPDSVEKIGAEAFYLREDSSNRDEIVDISLPFVGEHRDAYFEVNSLDKNVDYIKNQIKYIFKDYQIGKKYSLKITDATNIGAEAFKGDNHVTSIEIFDGVTSIEDNAFYNCTALSKIILPDTLEHLGVGVFYGTSHTSAYDDRVFTDGDFQYIGSKTNPYLVLVEYRDDDVVSLKIHERTKIIAYNVFAAWKKELTSIDLSNVEVIGANAFNDCSNLKNIIMSNKLKRIEHHAFMFCKKLKNIKLNDGLKYLGECAFQNCTELEWIYIPSGVTTISSGTFWGDLKVKIFLDEERPLESWNQYWIGEDNLSLYWKNQWKWQEDVPVANQ